MQYILSEEEYNRLINKERIKAPIEEFCNSLHKTIKRLGAEKECFSPHSPINEFMSDIKLIIQTLQIKLDL